MLITILKELFGGKHFYAHGVENRVNIIDLAGSDC